MVWEGEDVEAVSVSEHWSDSENLTEDEGDVSELASPSIVDYFDFGESLINMHSIKSFENAGYFPAKAARMSEGETVPSPKENEVVVFRDFLVWGLCFPPHNFLAEVMDRFYVQMHQLTPNSFVQLSKFIWAVAASEVIQALKFFANIMKCIAGHERSSWEKRKQGFVSTKLLLFAPVVAEELLPMWCNISKLPRTSGITSRIIGFIWSWKMQRVGLVHPGCLLWTWRCN
jgi:hypothetical protein